MIRADLSTTQELISPQLLLGVLLGASASSKCRMIRRICCMREKTPASREQTDQQQRAYSSAQWCATSSMNANGHWACFPLHARTGQAPGTHRHPQSLAACDPLSSALCPTRNLLCARLLSSRFRLWLKVFLRVILPSRADL